MKILLANTQTGANTTVAGIVSSEGIWRVKLPAQPGGEAPYVLYGHSPDTGESWMLEDVLFGDVIVCGGQSNMALGMGEINNSSAEIAAALKRPAIRLFSPQYSAQNQSQAQFVLQYAINWTSAAGTVVAGFSAVCYLTAAGIYDQHAGQLPLGLIDTAVGGTMIQLWLPPAHVGDCPLPFVPTWPWTLSCWFNGMVAPLAAGPTDLKMILWDQGENNVGFREYYECAFPTMIRAWRHLLQADGAPFLFVQLPEYINANNSDLAELREGQLSGLQLPNVSFVCTADNGDPLGKDTSIHTLDKTTVGRRLAATALCTAYGRSEQPCHSPRYGKATAITRGLTVTVTITVVSEGLAGGLVWVAPSPASNSSWCPHSKMVETRSCAWFAVQTSDQAWLNASAAISSDGTAVVLTATAATVGLQAVATANGYGDWPVVNVYNRAGLPLVPWTPRKIEYSEGNNRMLAE